MNITAHQGSSCQFYSPRGLRLYYCNLSGLNLAVPQQGTSGAVLSCQIGSRCKYDHFVSSAGKGTRVMPASQDPYPAQHPAGPTPARSNWTPGRRRGGPKLHMTCEPFRVHVVKIIVSCIEICASSNGVM